MLSLFVLLVLFLPHWSFQLCISLLKFSWSCGETVPTGSPSRGGNVTVHVCDINQPSLSTPFYSVLVSISVFMALSTVFRSINSPDNSVFSLCSSGLNLCPIGPFNYMSLYESLLQP